ncbi:hypothetical protein BAU15_12120 [Enterococcus sp. JM4C]|uniref:MurR/RpiR family transcriptional regulator n=1 Tax=Candidatus Enterococcus huntleyi TaxID=1857217 RepID=UPI001379848C|nr:MurR/RpiR family transcriptional regulator [Enterococcus sp. JM4C]KAF1296024.1 hypothetical protein BAU15_12120 [Enterococcus sp. JM4C]
MIIDKLNDLINANEEGSTASIISKFVKANIATLHELTIDEIAASCYVSKGQVSKYVKRLDYETFGEFRLACLDYCDSLTRKNRLFTKEQSLQENSQLTTRELSKALDYVATAINYQQLEKFSTTLLTSQKIYVYAQGEARALCNYLQAELSPFQKEVIICDSDFLKITQLNRQDALLIMSINGQSFQYNQRIIKRLTTSPANKWLLTCKEDLPFSSNTLLVPSYNKRFNTLAVRHVLDLLIAQIAISQSAR